MNNESRKLRAPNWMKYSKNGIKTHTMKRLSFNVLLGREIRKNEESTNRTLRST